MENNYITDLVDGFGPFSWNLVHQLGDPFKIYGENCQCALHLHVFDAIVHIPGQYLPEF